MQKILTLGSLANILEWLDFGLFIYFAPMIGATFFPATITHVDLAALSVFAIGFIFRPLGGIALGHWGDRIGRSKALCISMAGMSFSTLGIGLLPGYHSLGLLSTVLLILLRLCQGFFVGGEYSGVAVYIAESVNARYRGFFTSFAATGANLGFLLATLSALLLNGFMAQSVSSAGLWRLPFIAGGIIGFIILKYRLQLVETPVYLSLSIQQAIRRRPLLSVLQESPQSLLQILGITCMGSIFYMTFFGFMPTYLESTQVFSHTATFAIQSILLVLMMLCIPLSGYCGDRIGRRKVLMAVAIGIIIFSLPAVYFLHTEIAVMTICVLIGAMGLSALEQGNTLITAVENFPANIRYTGVALSYNIGNALFGGTAPLLAAVLMDYSPQHRFMLGYYLMLAALMGLISSWSLTRKCALD
ncbi:MAG: MFS transporter [Gammaproteobacteria bacterium]